MSSRILIADDEPSVLHLLELVLTNEGYQVLMAANGDQLVRMAQAVVPDLVIVDLMMPSMDGYEAIRQLRNDTRTAHLPMLILTAKSAPDDVVTGFETGADDYITKPFNIPELLARIRGHLRRAQAQPVRSPLTGLSGNVLLSEEIKYRLRSQAPFALIYIDLDNFKAFNDTYGPARGDRVILALAEILLESIQAHGSSGDFIGHIGGDDFAIVTLPELAEPIVHDLIERFDVRVRNLYDDADLERGYLQGVDRQGVPRRFPITTLSIGVVTNLRRTFSDHEAISRVAAEMKAFAKQQPGSSFAIDNRSDDAQVEQERRGEQRPTIVITSPHDRARARVAALLGDAGYRALEATSVADVHALLVQNLEIKLVILDTTLTSGVDELLLTLRESAPRIEILQMTVAPGEAGAIRVKVWPATSELQPGSHESIAAHVSRLIGLSQQAEE
jgi:PleD family two-component response regulator